MDNTPATTPAPAVAAPVVEAVQLVRDRLGGALAASQSPTLTADIVQTVWTELERVQRQLFTALGALEASGQLPEATGQKTLKTWITHRLRVSPTHAREMAGLSALSHSSTLPRVERALSDGSISVGEAATLVRLVNNAVRDRDTTQHPDERVYRGMFESRLVRAKEHKPTMSVAQLGREASTLRAEFNAHQFEIRHAQAHAGRGAQLRTRTAEGEDTPDGTFLFQVWGALADSVFVRAALDAFLDSQGPKDPRTRPLREHDALIAALRFAAGHRGCSRRHPTALIRITVPATTLMGDTMGRPATTDQGDILPASLVRELGAESVIVRMLTDPPTGRVMDVGRAVRLVPPQMRTAAFHTHTTCAWEGGCDVPAQDCDADHKHVFWQGGPTSADNTQPLCADHNRLKHRWAMYRDQERWKQRRTHPNTSRRDRGRTAPRTRPPSPHRRRGR